MYQPPKPNWWSRNWKWFIPAGCLTTLLVCAGGLTLYLVFIFSKIKSSEVYKEAVLRAKASEEVQAVLGTPIEEGFLVSGNIRLSGSSGQADLTIPISGPKGAATLYVEAEKSAGKWVFSTLVVAPEGSETKIDLLAGTEW